MLGANWDLDLIKEKNYHCSTRDEIYSLKEWKKSWRLWKPEMNSFFLRGTGFCVAMKKKKKGGHMLPFWFVNNRWVPKEMSDVEREKKD